VRVLFIAYAGLILTGLVLYLVIGLLSL